MKGTGIVRTLFMVKNFESHKEGLSEPNNLQAQRLHYKMVPGVAHCPVPQNRPSKILQEESKNQ